MLRTGVAVLLCVCVHTLPEAAVVTYPPWTPSPLTQVPGIGEVCKVHDTGPYDSGRVSYSDNVTKCWMLPCQYDMNLVITFLDMHFPENADSSFEVYSDTDPFQYPYPFRSLQKGALSSNSIVENLGSTYVNFTTVLTTPGETLENSDFQFDYACRYAVPSIHKCQVTTDLGDTYAGMVRNSFDLSSSKKHQCWHMPCNEIVWISFTIFELANAFVDLLSSTDGEVYTLQRSYNRFNSSPGVVMLYGPVSLQFNDFDSVADQSSKISFDYACREGTLAPPTLTPVDTYAPPTVAPSPAPDTPAPTSAPDTSAPATHAPPTFAPATHAPPTFAPLTPIPVPPTSAPTSAPDTSAPATQAPPTVAPVTYAPDTSAPATQAPPTVAPLTQIPVPPTSAPTSAPDTSAPATQAPPTSAPVTYAPDTSAPATQTTPTFAPTSPKAPSDAPETSAPDTGVPQTPAPSTRTDTLVPDTDGAIRRVDSVCTEYPDVNNTVGHVRFVNKAPSIVCWHIACNDEVVLTFSTLELDDKSYLGVYSSAASRSDEHLERAFAPSSSYTGDIVLKGPALVKFGTVSANRSVLDFEYVCRSVGGNNGSSGSGDESEGAFPYFVVGVTAAGVVGLLLCGLLVKQTYRYRSEDTTGEMQVMEDNILIV